MASSTHPLATFQDLWARATANLNERERRLVTVMVGVFATLVLFLPALAITNAIGSLQEENEELRVVIGEIQRSRETLAQRRAERAAAEALYATPPPALGGFIEARARDQDLTLREVNDQPEKVLGRFRRRNVRATLPGVELRAVIKMLTAIENSGHPIALERLQVEHFRSGDAYNVQFGVVAYETDQEAEEAEASMSSAMGRRGRSGMRAGPPSP